MLAESVRFTRPAFFNNGSTHFNQNGETFREVFERHLNGESDSRPPKVEVTGILMPFRKVFGGRVYRYKLDTGASEYILEMSGRLEEMAQKVEFEEVTVKGQLDLGNRLFEVEKISVKQGEGALKAFIPAEDFNFDDEDYQRVIAQLGKLEPAPDDLAS